MLSKFAVCALTAASLTGAALGKCYPPTIPSHNNWAVSVFTATDCDDGSTIQSFTGNFSDYSPKRCHKLNKHTAAHLESFTYHSHVKDWPLTWYSNPHCYIETAMRFKNQKGDRMTNSLVLPGLYNAASQDGVFKAVAFTVA